MKRAGVACLSESAAQAPWLSCHRVFGHNGGVVDPGSSDIPQRGTPRIVVPGPVRIHRTDEQRLPEHALAEDDPRPLEVFLTFVAAARRRWRLALAVWLAVMLPVLAYSVTAVPAYTARGAIQVSEAGGILGSNPLSELVEAGAKAEVQTEVEIIRRPEFLVDVLTRVGMQVVDPEEPRWVTLDMRIALWGGTPVSPRMRALRKAVRVASVPAGWFAPVRVLLSVPAAGRLRARIGGDSAESTEFAVGEIIEHRHARLQFDKDPLPIGDSITFDLLPEGELLERSAARILVSGLGAARAPTNIVEVSVTNTDREMARAIAQSLMDRYLAKSLEWKTQSASQAAEFIEGQLQKVRQDLSSAEDRLKSYSQRENAIQLDTQAKVAIERAAELEAQRMGIELQEKTIGSVLGRIAKGVGARASLTANFFDDPVLAASVQSLTEAETAFEMLRASHTPEHPRVQELERALGFRKQEVANLMRSAQKNLAQQKHEVEGELVKSDEGMKKYPDRQLEVARLMREMSASERVYTLLLEKHEEAQIVRASTTTDKRIVDTASLPHRKTSPRRGMLALLGVLGGLLLALGVAFAAHVLQRKLDTVEAVREEAPFPTYGTVPFIDERGVQAEQLTPEDVWAKPHESAPEALRALAVSASLLPADTDGGRVIMITSSQPREGKSTIASGLAVAMGRMGKRVLLIDLDLRKPVQHRTWKIPRAPGYSDLVGQGGTAQDLPRLAHQRLDFSTTVLTAGTPLPDTVAAIVAPALPKLLAAWSREYDWIVLDSPPAFVAETAVLAQQADLILLVARPGVVERANLRHAIEALERIDVPRGLVLNGVGRQHTGYYYGSGYYYYHSSYGRDAAAEKSGEKRAAS